jgi:hypothetical protein
MTKAYFVYGDQCLRFDVESERVDEAYPNELSGGWTHLDVAFRSGIDAALDLGGGDVHFF